LLEDVQKFPIPKYLDENIARIYAVTSQTVVLTRTINAFSRTILDQIKSSSAATKKAIDQTSNPSKPKIKVLATCAPLYFGYDSYDRVRRRPR
jgi:hypothetical protein